MRRSNVSITSFGFPTPVSMGAIQMLSSPRTSVYTRWTQPSYEIKVRGTLPTLRSPNYLWGSAGITKDITFDKPLLLHIHNDPFGEAITFGRQKASGTKETIGTLE